MVPKGWRTELDEGKKSLRNMAEEEDHISQKTIQKGIGSGSGTVPYVITSGTL